MRLIQFKSLAGQAVQVNQYTITPKSWAVSVGIPKVGFTWQFPTAVVVETKGTVKRLPIIDITRVIQISALLIQLYCHNKKVGYEQKIGKEWHYDR